MNIYIYIYGYIIYITRVPCTAYVGYRRCGVDEKQQRIRLSSRRGEKRVGEKRREEKTGPDAAR